jgi:hypothetical protein
MDLTTAQTAAGVKTFSSNPILSAGTANGVAYLNGSKALTTGSALIFDGTNLGVGVTPKAYTAGKAIDISSNGGIFGDGVTFNWAMGITQNAYRLADGSFKYKATGQTAGGLEINGNTFRFLTAASGTANAAISFTESMTLTSAGLLGIGTTTPSATAKVTVRDATYGVFRGENTVGGYALFGATANASSEGFLDATNAFGFKVDGTERARLTTAGNFGLGTTSPLTATGYSALTVNGSTGGVLFLTTGGTKTAQFYNTSTTTAIGSVTAIPLVFLTTDTERMRLDSSGNLGLGVTPSAWGSNTRAFDQQSYNTFSGGDDGSRVYMLLGSNFYEAAAGTQRYKVTAATIPASMYKQRDGVHSWYYAANGTAGNVISWTQAMTLTAAGDLCVGVTSAFSSGKVCIQVANGATQNGITIQDNASSGFSYIAFSNGSGSTIASISRVGTTNAVAYNTTSDYRLKTVHGALTGYGERIDALKPIRYEWKDGAIQARGFLAHEFQTVYPNSVTGDKDAVDADGNPVYQAMQASTAEVIADLVAEIQSLRQRLSAANL